MQTRKKMLVLGAVIFVSLATAIDACIPVVFFCSQKFNEEEENERFSSSRTQYHVANEV